jgi:ankyrin repeat protein
MLIDAGAKIGANDYARLQAAIHSGKPELVGMLIAKGVDPTAHSKPDPNFTTHSAFAAAGMSNNVELIKLLVSKSRKGPALRTLLNDALQYAAEYGRAPVADFLLNNTDVDLNREVESNYGGVERLADTKKKVPGFTALSRAIEQGHEDIADALLKKGARVSGRTRSGAPVLSFVISQNRDDLFNMLLEHNPPLEAVDYDGRTALMAAAVQGRLDMVKALLARGASLDKPDSYQSTALMLACEVGKNVVVEYLLNAGANLHAQDKDGRDALIYAAMGGQDEICSLLISRGASPNLRTKTGMTALHWAAKKARTRAVKELLTHGASSNIADKDGKKAVDYARLAGDAESVALLTSKELIH